MIVAGFGFSSRATHASLREALERARGGWRIDALATLADKTAALAPLAQELGLAVIAIDGPLPETPTQSARSRSERGTGSVAEACALAAVGAGGYLRQTRVTSTDRLATCAIAQGGLE
ncbi:MAG: cobalamin biosynthesis protein [Pararhodobacter sp.]|nr:cobalamin biosynthesis protein [Pararhodobacter sp.]